MTTKELYLIFAGAIALFILIQTLIITILASNGAKKSTIIKATIILNSILLIALGLLYWKFELVVM